MTDQLFLLSLTSASGHVCDYTNNIAVNISRRSRGEPLIIHRFKVVGENTIILVVQEAEANSVDNLIRYRLSKNLTVNSCTPLLAYDAFAQAIGVTIPCDKPLGLGNGNYHWLEFNIEYPGKTMEELLEIWKKEAEVAVAAQRSKRVDLYKVVGERKVHLFTDSSSEDVDQMTFSLPLMVSLGDSAVIKTKALLRF